MSFFIEIDLVMMVNTNKISGKIAFLHNYSVTTEKDGLQFYQQSH